MTIITSWLVIIENKKETRLGNWGQNAKRDEVHVPRVSLFIYYMLLICAVDGTAESLFR